MNVVLFYLMILYNNEYLLRTTESQLSEQSWIGEILFPNEQFFLEFAVILSTLQ